MLAVDLDLPMVSSDGKHPLKNNKKCGINDRKTTFPSHPREACQIRMDCYVFWQTEAKRKKITMFYYILMIMEIILPAIYTRLMKRGFKFPCKVQTLWNKTFSATVSGNIWLLM